jgi:hypothetical protein
MEPELATDSHLEPNKSSSETPSYLFKIRSSIILASMPISSYWFSLFRFSDKIFVLCNICQHTACYGEEMRGPNPQSGGHPLSAVAATLQI